MLTLFYLWRNYDSEEDKVYHVYSGSLSAIPLCHINNISMYLKRIIEEQNGNGLVP